METAVCVTPEHCSQPQLFPCVHLLPWRSFLHPDPQTDGVIIKELFTGAKECFGSAKDVLKLTKEKLKAVKIEEKAAAAADPDELPERVAKNGRRSLRKRRTTVRKNAEKDNIHKSPADNAGNNAGKNASPARRSNNSKTVQPLTNNAGRASTGGTRLNSQTHKKEGEHTIKRSKTFGMKK